MTYFVFILGRAVVLFLFMWPLTSHDTCPLSPPMFPRQHLFHTMILTLTYCSSREKWDTLVLLSVIWPLTSDPQGDNSIIAFEYVEDKEPYLFDVAPFLCGSPHQVQIFVCYASYASFDDIMMCTGMNTITTFRSAWFALQVYMSAQFLCADMYKRM